MEADLADLMGPYSPGRGQLSLSCHDLANRLMSCREAVLRGMKVFLRMIEEV